VRNRDIATVTITKAMSDSPHWRAVTTVDPMEDFHAEMA
jgi:hypothetical protein